MIFSCVGFDIREYPCKVGFSADSAEWERNEIWHEKLTRDFDIAVNVYGLLDIKNQSKLSEVSQYVITNIPTCDFVAIEIPLKVVEFYDNRWGSTIASNKVDLSGFFCHGFDVCDVDGLFTMFNHSKIQPFQEENGLIAESRIVDALEAVQLANVVVESSHCPCVIAKVYSLRK